MDTARPPASSEASEMREPLERRAKLFCKRELLLLRLSAERDAAVLVLTTILMSFCCESYEVGDFLVFPEKYSVHRDYREASGNHLVLFEKKPVFFQKSQKVWLEAALCP
jgi:hypothetical protein